MSDGKNRVLSLSAFDSSVVTFCGIQQTEVTCRLLVKIMASEGSTSEIELPNFFNVLLNVHLEIIV
jgi:hypothetical protein